MRKSLLGAAMATMVALAVNAATGGTAAASTTFANALNGTDNLPTGLDRIDQRAGLSKSYSSAATGKGVSVYVVDSGVYRDSAQFGGRVTVGYDAFGGDGQDCYYHGTHVAGIAAGRDLGVAPEATIVSVRVLNCQGEVKLVHTDPKTVKWSVVAGLDWVATHAHKPAVVNLSIGGSPDPSLDAAVQRVISAGVAVVVAAGNANIDACNNSPARVPQAVTVGAIDPTTDRRATFSNWGRCIDIFAPGVNIRSAWYKPRVNPDGTVDKDVQNVAAGTSFAAPHVAGVFALYLETHPSATPAEVRNAVIAAATNGLVTEPNGAIMRTSPSSELYSRL